MSTSSQGHQHSRHSTRKSADRSSTSSSTSSSSSSKQPGQQKRHPPRDSDTSNNSGGSSSRHKSPRKKSSRSGSNHSHRSHRSNSNHSMSNTSSILSAMSNSSTNGKSFNNSLNEISSTSSSTATNLNLNTSCGKSDDGQLSTSMSQSYHMPNTPFSVNGFFNEGLMGSNSYHTMSQQPPHTQITDESLFHSLRSHTHMSLKLAQETEARFTMKINEYAKIQQHTMAEKRKLDVQLAEIIASSIEKEKSVKTSTIAFTTQINEKNARITKLEYENKALAQQLKECQNEKQSMEMDLNAMQNKLSQIQSLMMGDFPSSSSSSNKKRKLSQVK